jgi:hypothetical protein
VRNAGRKGVEIGGKVTVTFVGEGEAKNKIYNPPKLYKVTYQPPDASAQFLASAPTGGSASTSGSAPAGLDPQAWAGLDEARRASVLAAMASPAAAGSGVEPPF